MHRKQIVEVEEARKVRVKLDPRSLNDAILDREKHLDHHEGKITWNIRLGL